MHVGARIATTITITAALISAGIFLWYSIQVDSDAQWLYRTAVTLSISGVSIGIATWIQVRAVKKEFREFRDDVKSRMAIQEMFDGDECLLRTAFDRDDR